MKKRKWIAALCVVVLLAAGTAVFLACRVSLRGYALSLPEKHFVDKNCFVWQAMGDPPGETECTVRCEGSRHVPFWVRPEADATDSPLSSGTESAYMLRSDGSLWEIVWDTGGVRMLRRVQELDGA